QCADCHILGTRRQIESSPEDPRYVRSPAVTLTHSRCYTESSGGLSCLTCHSGHRDSERAEAFYEFKCLECHSDSIPLAKGAGAASDRSKSAPARAGRACKVNPKQGCLDCHMPKIPVDGLRTSMTDHYIRIHQRNTP